MTIFYDPCNDISFKKMFLEHPDRTISFLNAVLKLEGDRRIQSVEFLPQELLPLIAESKKSVLDVRVTDHRRFQYIVEVQNRYMSSYLNRVQYYASHVYVGQMKKAGAYNTLKPVTVLSILNHGLFPEEVPYLSFHQNMETKTGESYMNDMAYVFVELPKFTLKLDQIKTLEDYWIFLFKEAQNLDAIPQNAPEEIKSAFEELEEHNWSEPEREAYFRYNIAMMDDEDAIRSSMEKGLAKGREEGLEKGREEGREEGRKEGMEEGREERTIEIVKNMLTHNMDIKLIAETTGLTEDEIKKIKRLGF